MPLLSPIVAVLGHVDHGKTSLLDAIRGSKVAEKEAGRITQMIGASFVPKEHIEALAKDILDVFKIRVEVPGLLFIDTPGHEAFTSMRVRGGSIANIAVLVIDITQGIQPQTVESIEILKRYKTPFVVALTKVDLIDGWRDTGRKSILFALKEQRPETLQRLEERLYTIVGQLAEHGFNSERFDRVSDFTKEVALIPVSSKTGEGLAELLLLLAGLSQKYLKDRLIVPEDAKAKGTIIEVKEEKGLGATADVILHEGILRKGDRVAFIGRDGVVETKIRALLMPNVASNNPKERYIYVDEVVAAAGVKLFAPRLEEAIPGSPIVDVSLAKELREEMQRWRFEGKEGVVVKADSIGSAEAIVRLFQKEGIPIAKLDIGKVSKEDVAYAAAVKESNDEHAVILAFNVPIDREAEELARAEGIPILWSNVIYMLADRYKEWLKAFREEKRKRMAEKVVYPAKVRVLEERFFFRMKDPAIFGVEVLEGKLRAGAKLMDGEGNVKGEVKSIQENKQSLREVEKGKKVAVSLSSAVLKKDIKPGMVLYSAMGERDVAFWQSNPSLLTEEEQELVEEIRKILLKAKVKRKVGA